MVRTGKVLYASKHFMEGYKKEQGNLLGIQLRDQVQPGLPGLGGRDKNDPAAFQEFVTKFMADNIPRNTSTTLTCCGLEPAPRGPQPGCLHGVVG